MVVISIKQDEIDVEVAMTYSLFCDDDPIIRESVLNHVKYEVVPRRCTGIQNTNPINDARRKDIETNESPHSRSMRAVRPKFVSVTNRNPKAHDRTQNSTAATMYRLYRKMYVTM